jgi:hypothetical protein
MSKYRLPQVYAYLLQRLPLRLINRHCKTQPHWKLFPTVLSGTLPQIGSKRNAWNHSILSVKLAVNDFNLNRVLAQLCDNHASPIA